MCHLDPISQGPDWGIQLLHLQQAFNVDINQNKNNWRYLISLSTLYSLHIHTREGDNIRCQQYLKKQESL